MGLIIFMAARWYLHVLQTNLVTQTQDKVGDNILIKYYLIYNMEGHIVLLQVKLVIILLAARWCLLVIQANLVIQTQDTVKENILIQVLRKCGTRLYKKMSFDKSNWIISWMIFVVSILSIEKIKNKWIFIFKRLP